MTNRAIVIFPKFNNIHLIDEVRQKFDPLFTYIAPHITLVFPFESEISTSILEEHIQQQLKGIEKFNIVISGVTGASDGYIYLDVKAGNDKIIELHNNLYKKLLLKHHNRFIPYHPHITIGRVSSSDKHKEIVQSMLQFDSIFETVVEEVSVEVLDNNEKSMTEYVHKLTSSSKSNI